MDKYSAKERSYRDKREEEEEREKKNREQI